MTNNIAILLFLAVSIEGLIQWLKAEYRNKWTYLAFLLGLVAVVALGFNPLIVLGVVAKTDVQAVAVALIGYLLGATAIARGSNYLNDFVSMIRKA